MGLQLGNWCLLSLTTHGMLEVIRFHFNLLGTYICLLNTSPYSLVTYLDTEQMLNIVFVHYHAREAYRLQLCTTVYTFYFEDDCNTDYTHYESVIFTGYCLWQLFQYKFETHPCSIWMLLIWPIQNSYFILRLFYNYNNWMV